MTPSWLSVSSAEEGAASHFGYDIVMLGDGDKVTIGTPKVDGAGCQCNGSAARHVAQKSSFSDVSAGKTIVVRKAIGRI